MSMLRSYTWADLLTILNASCGTIAVFLCLDYIATDNRRFLWAAFFLLPAALLFDVLDGYVARLDSRRQSVLGADLDSLADVISFGVAPAVLGFTLAWMVLETIVRVRVIYAVAAVLFGFIAAFAIKTARRVQWQAGLAPELRQAPSASATSSATPTASTPEHART